MANLKSFGKSKGFANCSKKAPFLLIADVCPHFFEPGWTTVQLVSNVLDSAKQGQLLLFNYTSQTIRRPVVNLTIPLSMFQNCYSRS